jgi:hypothetical protein
MVCWYFSLRAANSRQKSMDASCKVLPKWIQKSFLSESSFDLLSCDMYDWKGGRNAFEAVA